MKYRKKPVVIEAVQWWRDGHGNNNFTEVEALNKGSCRELLVNEGGSHGCGSPSSYGLCGWYAGARR